MILCELDFYPQYEIFVCLYQFVLYVYLYAYDILYLFNNRTFYNFETRESTVNKVLT